MAVCSSACGSSKTVGTITEFPVPKSNPSGIAAGPDGNLWFGEGETRQIGRITTSGTITEFSVFAGFPLGIVAGPDGNLWFTHDASNQIARLTPSGTITGFPIPGSYYYHPLSIAGGPDGNLWFIESTGALTFDLDLPDQIGRITISGTITEFPIPTAYCEANSIAPGPDGNLWFTEGYGTTSAALRPAGPSPSSRSRRATACRTASPLAQTETCGLLKTSETRSAT